jgi:excisionase family DNA binding protein
MTIAQTMDATGFSRRTIQNLFRSGLLSRVKVGGRVLISRADVANVAQRIGVFNGRRSLDPAIGPRRLHGAVSERSELVPEFIEDMHRTDIVEALQRLPLRTSASTCLVRLDRGVRDFIVTALRSR